LPIARLEPLGIEETGVGALDLGLEFGTEHDDLGAKRLDKFSVFANGRYHNALFDPAQNRLPDR
jgi:hypothetical protein